jgi:hypothetical protein
MPIIHHNGISVPVNEDKIEQICEPILPSDSFLCNDCEREVAAALVANMKLTTSRPAVMKVRCVTTDLFVCRDHAKARGLL